MKRGRKEKEEGTNGKGQYLKMQKKKNLNWGKSEEEKAGKG